MNTTIKTIKDKNVNLIKKISLFRCGFELETQSWNGCTLDELSENNDCEQEIDEERLSRDTRYHITRFLAGQVGSLSVRIAQLFMRGVDRYLELTEEQTNNDNFTKYDPIEWTEEQRDNFAEEMDEPVRQFLLGHGDYYFEQQPDTGLALEDIVSSIDNFNITAEEDGSVEGPEIQTNGPLTRIDFLKALRAVLEHDFTVNEECSFHIHISAEGVNHQYGKYFQSAIYYYLYQNFDKVPLSVKKRWAKDEWRNRYFCIEFDSSEKYSFVAYRGKTWEFRCWGNIDNYIDGRRCLALSILAMIYAYNNLHDLPAWWNVDALNNKIDSWSEAYEMDNNNEDNEERAA